MTEMMLQSRRRQGNTHTYQEGQNGTGPDRRRRCGGCRKLAHLVHMTDLTSLARGLKNSIQTFFCSLHKLLREDLTEAEVSGSACGCLFDCR